MRSGVVATVGAFNPDDSQRWDGPCLLGAIRFARGLLLAFAVVAGCELHAQPPGGESTRATADRRPVVALVLSGGGARGAAHVGVIKVLEQYGVPMDIIAGTSAGAIVGGLYAAGKSAQQIEEALLSIDWQQVLS
ncbi:MAG: patatin-like phospholipase family protein, partial [Betaproteobacteria bacterium]